MCSMLTWGCIRSLQTLFLYIEWLKVGASPSYSWFLVSSSLLHSCTNCSNSTISCYKNETHQCIPDPFTGVMKNMYIYIQGTNKYGSTSILTYRYLAGLEGNDLPHADNVVESLDISDMGIYLQIKSMIVMNSSYIYHLSTLPLSHSLCLQLACLQRSHCMFLNCVGL